jgi:hypothetical protein
MPYDLTALKVLFKKIFPPKKSIYTVDSNGDGKVDSILIKALNVIMPIEIPEDIELGGFSTKNFNLKNFDLSEYGKIYLDDEPITIAKEDFDVERIKERFLIYHRSEEFTVDDIIKGKLGGRIIALGDSINIIIKIDEEGFKKFSKGRHTFKFESELIPTLEFNFELTDENLNQKFNPNDI